MVVLTIPPPSLSQTQTPIQEEAVIIPTDIISFIIRDVQTSSEDKTN